MARISTYQRDTVITRDDKVIGSDFNGSVTKNFNLGDLSNFFSSNNTVVGQISYIFKDYLGDGIITGITNNAAFSSLTAFKVSSVDTSGTSIENFLLEYADKKIALVQVDDKNNYGIFTVNSVYEDVDNLGYYDFSLTHISSNSNLKLDKYYIIGLFGDSEGDKHATLTFTTGTFGNPPNEETINGISMKYITFDHNLNKKPSITVSENGSLDRVSYTDIKYINNNTVRVYFKGLTSGKIYAN